MMRQDKGIHSLKWHQCSRERNYAFVPNSVATCVTCDSGQFGLGGYCCHGQQGGCSIREILGWVGRTVDLLYETCF